MEMCPSPDLPQSLKTIAFGIAPCCVSSKRLSIHWIQIRLTTHTHTHTHTHTLLFLVLCGTNFVRAASPEDSKGGGRGGAQATVTLQELPPPLCSFVRCSRNFLFLRAFPLVRQRLMQSL